MRADRDPLIIDIKKHNPTKLLVQLRDGETKSLPISSKANRWERLLQTLSSLPWNTIEMLDASGGTLGILEADIDTSDDDALAAAKYADMKAMANVLLDVMKTTQKETARQFESQMDYLNQLAASTMKSVEVVQASYAHALKVNAAAQVMDAVPASADSDVMKMLQMALMLKQQEQPKPMPMRAAPKPQPIKPAPQPAVQNGVS